MSTRLLLSCGEPSGDLYAGALVRELRTLLPDIVVEGLGGPHFSAAGGRLLADYRGLAVTGLTEAISKVPRSLRTIGTLVNAARANRPHALVAIDFPDFNFPLARRIRRLGIPVIYYISPQIWAWRRGRLKTIGQLANRVLVIFPFEEDIYRGARVPVEFVGHPLTDLVRVTAPRDAFAASLGLSGSAPTVALLPGSRPNEVKRILPDMLKAARIIRRQVADAQFVVARAPHLDDHLFAELLVNDLHGPQIAVVEHDADTVLASADAAVVASGTATVQAAIHGTPMVIVYRLSPLTYQLARRLVKVDAVGMVNLIAGERVAPELLQEQFTPDAVAAEVVSLLTDAGRARGIRESLARVRSRLGPPGASGRAAAAIVRAIGAST